MTPISKHLRMELLEELFAVEDKAKSLIRRIQLELGPEIRDELRYVNAKGEIFFAGVDDLIHFDPTQRSSVDAQLRELRRETDELILRRAEIDRKLRDSRRHAIEVEEDVHVARAHRSAEEIRVEIARLDGLDPAR